ncbi:protein NdvB [Clostridium pasteurianum DSM 525 = ATCC 6013]|uniref:Protein NdvB n=1 Tax=Clostridium pasteurianum DSM 525 = ATCC 6013 TaxID=1262449 RepID=A0A0H3J607_CLOPA|nr:glucoamylase family protein [Clostridium pasteurianum]AJA47338.1 protein NdvB [Clostridium pasteurianum DSM 525 = ATCC 6013]AJA51326.1 protein NdvB [Clostridium pasteurianum DSM 525 = ATCC 6013]AOZ74673.1 cyclic beta 1-2 glucan synthetase [Clostridium pasteurianum DSM 525 = ATCC 6013]AOZ78470.1 cyclic beta 1-2 glucan synthetase [Clostridium pasteurianum]ELP58675.1 Cyclic beta 1-2 glucan synthetase [Clostridium pasteurianum DSM 525 = ATCC 6013]
MPYIYMQVSIVILILSIFIVVAFEIRHRYDYLEQLPPINLKGDDVNSHAAYVSDYHGRAKTTNGKRKIMKSIDKDYRDIIKGYEYIDGDIRRNKDIVPAAEWLMDNLYLIEKEYKDIKHNLPEYCYKSLPAINKGLFKGYPRIYHIAMEIVSHADGKIDENTIVSFIESYQKQTVLTNAELWALPNMLRIALLHNIGSITNKIVTVQREKTRADKISDELINAVNNGVLEEKLNNITSEKIKFTIHFAGRLLKDLRDNGIEDKSIYDWIENNLAAIESNSEKIVIVEHQREIRFQLSMGNCINSIREVEALNWSQSFEKLSYMEEILRQDPSGIYSKMDFQSRDYYRHNLEKMAKKMNLPESYLAKLCVRCAMDAEDRGEEKEYEKHVGYYIIDDGVNCINKKIKHRSSVSFLKKHKAFWYILLNLAGTAGLVAFIIARSLADDTNFILWKYIVSGIAIVIPCSEIINSILNWSINHLTTPKFVPKIDLTEGIPGDCKSIVVIPAILNNEETVHNLMNKLEVYYLANEEDNLYFALLGDFKDSSTENEEEDNKINEAGLKDAKILNDKYKRKKDIFYFFNRSRMYNKNQGLWLGWERKRGKLMEFNELLRGNRETSYNVTSGSVMELQDVKYVITLDSDTQLPRDTAKKLIGAMTHILNKAVIDDNKEIKRGYGIMQPRISIDTVSANRTFYSKIFSGETGIDTYSMAVSDIYQDLFLEGIYTGKGIYEVDIFQNTITGNIKENSVLSHDLLEGEYARCALVTDVEFMDGYPAYFNSASKRLHRWIRGDWQLLPYIFKSSSLSAISRWKMIDNLRRSILAPSIIILLLFSLTIVPDGVDKWMSLIFISLICPWLFDVSEIVVSPMRGISISGKMSSNKNVIEQIFLIFTFLPYNAYLSLDAIFRTLYRIAISRKKLLEWQTAAYIESNINKKFTGYLSSMWMASGIAAVIAVMAYRVHNPVGYVLIPSCVLWFISPIIACLISKYRKRFSMKLSDEERNLLRRIGRKTFAYFEDFVNDEENWLAPDNYQEDPLKGVAHRTSPTNMGMGITSNLVGYDLGYITLEELLDRLDKILTNMESLEKYKGHFYNWYDTRSKLPLHPRYISTVDSGNLVGYLWLTSKALEEYINQPLIGRRYTRGLCDILRLSNEEIENSFSVKNHYNNVIAELENPNIEVVSWKKILYDILSDCERFEKNNKKIPLYWNSKAKHQIEQYLYEIDKIFPWTDIVSKRDEMINDKAISIKNLSTKIAFKDIPKEIDNIMSNFTVSDDTFGNDMNWIDKLINILKNSKFEIQNFINRVENIRTRLNNMAEETDFKILFDEKRQLFSIGYDMETNIISNCYYDLLASESRQASFVAIAKGDIDQIHWFKLGRSMTFMGKGKGLVSWSGTMFEYFMPLLIMKNYDDTLLKETYKSVVEGQKKYIKKRKLSCWGISESAFYKFDIASNYQYKAFGVPGIGLKRGLADELVISPYSTVLAMQQDISSALSNIKRLISEGMEGKYGFYEAVDYTKNRLPEGTKKSIIRCFMVHHEGMSLMALDNIINSFVLQKRFHALPRVKATELLLQERVPKRVVYDRNQVFEFVENKKNDRSNFIVRTYSNPKTEIPETHILSNGVYSMMISNSGSGYSKKNDMMLYRWNEDVTTDDSGLFFYIKDITDNKVWSAAYEPSKTRGDSYETIFALDKVEFKRSDGDVETRTEIAVSNEDNAEIRRITLKNNGNNEKVIELISYSEITLAPRNADEVHPAFSNLFIRTEFVEDPMCILANRRPRAKNQDKPWLMQTIYIDGERDNDNIQYETSRLNFLGRGRNLTNPISINDNKEFLNTVGNILDPIISIKKVIKIKPHTSCTIVFVNSISDSREDALNMAVKYRQLQNIDRVFELSFSQSQFELNYLGIKPNQANLYQLMASKILFINTMVREREYYIKEVSKSQSALWAYGISGDLPIVLLIVRNESDVDLVKQMLNAHEYWSMKGLKVDFVIINMKANSYLQQLESSLEDAIESNHSRDKQNKPAGVFLYNNSTMSEEDIKFLIGISRLVIDSNKGLLVSQIKSSIKLEENSKYIHVKDLNYNLSEFNYPDRKLIYDNGYGGFDEDTNEYIITLDNYKNTPAPWINVISNDKFGFHVSESGSAYTWFKNSRENKITPWSNDYITDKLGEAIYIRDEEDGKAWSISPKPIRDSGKYIIEHGFGYSNFKHTVNGIYGKMTMFASIEKSFKIINIGLKNISDIKRKLSVTYYSQIVLGVVPSHTGIHIFTDIDKDNNFIYARNPYSQNFGGYYAYLKIIGGGEESFTGNRKEFIGRGESLNLPEALKKVSLSNNVGAGLDPCMAQNSKIILEPGEEKNVWIIFGEDESLEKVKEIVKQYSIYDNVIREFHHAKAYWKDMLTKITVKTPDKTMNIMLNGWLMYQAISCRLWSRTAFYQSGGAYGFRDQLQDVMPLSFLKPEMTRKQIIISASRQFLEGDVQHWWHPVVDSGIRTRFSDDLLWLPYVTSDYIKNTGDYSILEESVEYLQDEPLKEGEDERYSISKKSEQRGTIYEHCIKALEKGLKFGIHNIPLMGSGDWNDGMSTVGNQGKGESVWLGWFVYSILRDFKIICKNKQDEYRSQRYSELSDFVKENMEKNAWDGNWYRRAYFDDGTPLGSSENDECKIDSLSQSWAVISRAASPDRAKMAMESLEKYLVKENERMILLLTPPFNNSKLEPGYIKGYVPGVRENGGQYTHAATWVILAMAKLGETDKAWKLFNMINPINHSKTKEESEIYKVEPYVMAADVYAGEPHTGRGGWTWYTGTAGWMYRVGIEGILGLSLVEGKGFRINPCVPREWKEYEINYRHKNCVYNIKIERSEDNRSITVNGEAVQDGIIPFMEEGTHKVEIKL